MKPLDFSTVPFQKSHPVTPIPFCIAEFMEAKGMGIGRILCIELPRQPQPQAILFFPIMTSVNSPVSSGHRKQNSQSRVVKS